MMQPNQPRDTTDRENQSEVLGHVAEQAMHQVGQITDTAKVKGFSWLADQKIQASGTLETTARAFVDIGHRLEQQGQGPIGQSLSLAGEKIEQFTRTLKDRDVDELYSDIEDLARRQPVYFFGGALILGLLAARFLKSTTQVSGSGIQSSYAPGAAGNVITGPFTQQNRPAARPGEIRPPSGTIGRPSPSGPIPRAGASDDWREETASGLGS